MTAQMSMLGILSIELYVAHQHGRSIEEIAAALKVPAESVAERIESARLCVEHQIPELVAQ